MSNWRRIGIITGSDSVNKATPRNDSEARKLAVAWVESYRCLFVDSCLFVCLWTVAMDAKSTGNDNSKSHKSQLQGHVQYLVDQLSLMYYELLKRSETITGARYRTQSMHLSGVMKGNTTRNIPRWSRNCIGLIRLVRFFRRWSLDNLFRSMMACMTSAFDFFKNYWIDSWIASIVFPTRESCAVRKTKGSKKIVAIDATYCERIPWSIHTKQPRFLPPNKQLCNSNTWPINPSLEEK